jgi:hypothetical protein
VSKKIKNGKEKHINSIVKLSYHLYSPLFLMLCEMSRAGKVEQVEQDKWVALLARGFDALLKIAQKLTCEERKLQTRLRFAHNEVRGIGHVLLPFPIL